MPTERSIPWLNRFNTFWMKVYKYNLVFNQPNQLSQTNIRSNMMRNEAIQSQNDMQIWVGPSGHLNFRISLS